MTDLYTALDLRKEKVLDLKKQVGLDGQKAQVVLCLDYSGSMSGLYGGGNVQELVERVLPLGLVFDDNGEVDCYLFSNGHKKIPVNINLQNVANYVQYQVMMSGYDMGGTEYAPVIRAIVEDFAHVERTGGIMGFGGTKKFAKMDLPTYVIFITDGDNSDHAATEKAIIEASHAGIFFQFIGIGNAAFSFLKQLDTMDGRFIDNANFFTVPNLAHKTDDELYGLLLQEFPSFVTGARAKQMIQ